MTLALQQTELYKQLSHPDNPASVHMSDVRLLKDIWSIQDDLPLLAEDARIYGLKNISFVAISLPWLKELTKLAVLVAIGNRRWSLIHLRKVLTATRNFNAWLIEQGYITPSTLNAQVVQQWKQNRTNEQNTGLSGLLCMLRQLGCIQFQVKFSQHEKLKHPKTIPEEVKHKLDIALEQLDKPVYLAFKLHAALGTRISEISKIPLDCLRWREGIPRIRLCTGKQDNSKQEQDLPKEMVLLVQQQQAFVRQKFGDFPWLFPNWKWSRTRFKGVCWPPTFEYRQEQLVQVSVKLNTLLKWLIKENDICTRDGSLASVTTHMYRRTYGTVADCMGKRPDQIQHGLRHTNPDMQDSYVYVSPQKQEKRIERVLVDKDGRRTFFRTDQDSEFLRREWGARQVELGICIRPSIMKDCEFEHVCLGCEYSRYAQEHLLRLLEVREANQQLQERCLKAGQSDSRRANSARQLISILNSILASLQKETGQEVSYESVEVL